MKILVTGGAGYIGSILVPALLDRWHPRPHVTVLDHLMHGEAQALAARCIEDRLTIVNGDARDSRVLEPLVAQSELVIPLAAIVGAPACAGDHTAAVSTNQHAINMLCGMLHESQHVIFPTTNSGYGQAGAAACTEETPQVPLSLYARTKVAAEQVVMERQNSVALRLATVFGVSPRMRMDLLVNDFVWRAVTDRAIVLYQPQFRRNFVHVRDVARAILHAMDYWGMMRGQAYNVGLDDANLTKIALAERIRTHIPDFAISVAGAGDDPDKRDYLVSNVKLATTGFLPAFSLDAGIVELIKFYGMLKRTRYGNV